MNMYNWFECKVKFEKLDNEGVPQKVNEPYLVDAISFTEAETRICKEMQPYIHGGEFQVTNIRRINIAEMIYDDAGDRWYRFRIVSMVVDEEKGVEKKVASNVFVQADDIFNAIKNLQAEYKSAYDYTVTSVTETAIMDVFPYAVEIKKEEQPTA
ncbi:MAG: DUF4494 domain-containing protein [Paludibacteraceae bacterium]|nr:DUF4494 domain-containing protein [Paludibacteraceae bacterium]